MSTRSETRSTIGLTVLEVLLISGVQVVLTLWLAGPMMAKRDARSSRINCANNLKQIGLAFKTWALDNHDRFPMEVSVAERGTMGMTNAGRLFTHFMVMSNELSTPRILVCPSDERRPAATNFWPAFADTNISYFVNLDATAADPPGKFLAGDANLTNAQTTKVVLLSTNQSLGWSKDLHRRRGWLLFIDGHVDIFTNGLIRPTVLYDSAVSKDRLLMP